MFENGQAGDRLSIILQAHLQHVLSGFQHAKPADPFIINNCCLTALAGCTGNIIAGGIVAGFDRDRIVQMVWGRIDAVIDEQIVLQGRPR